MPEKARGQICPGYLVQHLLMNAIGNRQSNCRFHAEGLSIGLTGAVMINNLSGILGFSYRDHGAGEVHCSVHRGLTQVTSGSTRDALLSFMALCSVHACLRLTDLRNLHLIPIAHALIASITFTRWLREHIQLHGLY